MSKSNKKQPKRGFKVNQKVRVKSLVNPSLPEEKDFYGENVGEIIEFLDKPRSSNNGAALVAITQMYGQQVKQYIDTDQLIALQE